MKRADLFDDIRAEALALLPAQPRYKAFIVCTPANGSGDILVPFAAHPRQHLGGRGR